jgi:hypothetical protein
MQGGEGGTYSMHRKIEMLNSFLLAEKEEMTW